MDDADGMTNETLQTMSIRLHPVLKQSIEREARKLRLKPSDFLRRRIEDAFAFDPDDRKWSDTDEDDE